MTLLRSVPSFGASSSSGDNAHHGAHTAKLLMGVELTEISLAGLPVFYPVGTCRRPGFCAAMDFSGTLDFNDPRPARLTMSAIQEFTDLTADPPVRGFLHEPVRPKGEALVLTHGAGANCQSRLLLALATAFADAGFLVLRCDLPFRQSRPHGPPFPAMAARDREGLRRAFAAMRQKTAGRIFLGGHSYGGRQA